MTPNFSDWLGNQHFLIKSFLVSLLLFFVFNLRLVIRNFPEPCFSHVELPIKALNCNDLVESLPRHLKGRPLHLFNARREVAQAAFGSEHLVGVLDGHVGGRQIQKYCVH